MIRHILIDKNKTNKQTLTGVGGRVGRAAARAFIANDGDCGTVASFFATAFNLDGSFKIASGQGFGLNLYLEETRSVA